MKTRQFSKLKRSCNQQIKPISSSSSRSNQANQCTSGGSFSQITQSFNDLKCIQQNVAVLMCYSEHCDKSSSLCGQRKCPCKDQHKKCLLYFHLQHWDEFFQTKNEKKKLFIQQIQQTFESMIDQLSRIKETTVAAVDNVFLNKKDIKILQKLRKSQFFNIKGKDLFSCSFTSQLQNSIQCQERNQEIMKKNIQILNSTLRTLITKFQRNLISGQFLVRKDLSISKLKIEEIKSSILTSNEELNKLQNFLPSRIIKSLSLLYRASDNNFQTIKFWQTCQNIPNTLVLIKTQTQKIIGGYTPVRWKKYQTKIQQSDPSGESFIFSLSLNQKFQLQNKEQATYFYNERWGPQFGKLSWGDLEISDKCNQEKSSVCFKGNVYQNQKYKEKTQLYEKFVGQKEHYFKIVEWEVFQVLF